MNFLLGQRFSSPLCGTKMFFRKDFLLDQNPAAWMDPFGDYRLLIGAADGFSGDFCWRLWFRQNFCLAIRFSGETRVEKHETSGNSRPISMCVLLSASKFLAHCEKHSFDCENRCLLKKCLSNLPLVCTISQILERKRRERPFGRVFSALATK